MNSYFPHETSGQQTIYESVITECIRFMGRDMFYIPRKLVSPDSIFNEDSLSEFTGSYPISIYMDDIEGFGGAGSFMQKFGIMMQEQAQFTVSRRDWEALVGQFGETIIPSRPCEGDLIWFPLTKSLLEIMFVEPQSPFYQVGQLPVWKFKVELFSHSSEVMNTDIEEVDALAMMKSFNLLDKNFDSENSPEDEIVLEDGTPLVQEQSEYVQNQEFKKEANKVLDFRETNFFAEFDS